jgi:hypothetical protein
MSDTYEQVSDQLRKRIDLIDIQRYEALIQAADRHQLRRKPVKPLPMHTFSQLVTTIYIKEPFNEDSCSNYFNSNGLNTIQEEQEAEYQRALEEYNKKALPEYEQYLQTDEYQAYLSEKERIEEEFNLQKQLVVQVGETCRKLLTLPFQVTQYDWDRITVEISNELQTANTDPAIYRDAIIASIAAICSNSEWTDTDKITGLNLFLIDAYIWAKETKSEIRLHLSTIMNNFEFPIPSKKSNSLHSMLTFLSPPSDPGTETAIPLNNDEAHHKITQKAEDCASQYILTEVPFRLPEYYTMDHTVAAEHTIHNGTTHR